MEAKDFFKLCKYNAVYPFSKMIMYDGSKYYPFEVVTWSNAQGKTQYSGVLIDKNKRSTLRVNLKKILD